MFGMTIKPPPPPKPPVALDTIQTPPAISTPPVVIRG